MSKHKTESYRELERLGKLGVKKFGRWATSGSNGMTWKWDCEHVHVHYCEKDSFGFDTLMLYRNGGLLCRLDDCESEVELLRRYLLLDELALL